MSLKGFIHASLGPIFLDTPGTLGNVSLRPSENAVNGNGSPTTLVVRACADLLRNGQKIGLGVMEVQFLGAQFSISEPEYW